jgi:uncharacterized protein (TIGR02594 family)
MGQIFIPDSPAINPGGDFNLEALNGSAPRYGDDIPQLEGDFPGGPGAPYDGATIQYTDPGPIPDGPGYERLDAILRNAAAQALNGEWREQGRPANPRIENCYRAVGGVLDGADQREDHHMWCAAFVGWALSEAGMSAPRSMWSQTYRQYGSEVDWRDFTKIRKWDIVVFKSRNRTNGGHVGFVAGIKNGKIQTLGGNQSDNLNVGDYSIEGNSLYVINVKRNWSIPEEFDVPLGAVDSAGVDLRET